MALPLREEDEERSPFSSKDDFTVCSKTLNRKDLIESAARRLAAQSLQSSGPAVWALLTAISHNARQRPQGKHILLTEDEHCIGRLVTDTQFKIESNSVSGSHCKIYRKRRAMEDVEKASSSRTSVFLMDTSSNGTFLNGEKLKKNGSGAKLQHGDIVSFSAVPHHELAFAYVYREVLNSLSSADGAALKRKAEVFVSENKRLKGIGIGAPDGPISLDDVRSLQRSNKELSKQLESHTLTTETIRNENSVALALHENDLKEMRESVSQSCLNEIKELKQTLAVKQNELIQIRALSSEQQEAIVDLNERLSGSMQLRAEADGIINSLKVVISERERQLDEERNQRRKERENALEEHKAALHRAHLEAQEELKRRSDNASRQERELKEVISKLQDSDMESRLLVETLRLKLEDSREGLVLSEKKVCQLEAQVQEEQQVSLKGRKKLDVLENEMKRLKKEIESEKPVGREEAWAKVSTLELEMTAAIWDLSVEKQKFQGARERIILRETQLQSFYSTTEEISALFTKQQEQLKAMQRNLEDEENNYNISFDIDENAAKEKLKETMFRAKQALTPQGNNDVRESSSASTVRVDRIQVESTNDEASVTEKHECNIRNQEDCHTQDPESMSADCTVKVNVGSDVEGAGTAPGIDGDTIETERVLETESPASDTSVCGGRPTGDTIPFDDDVQAQENGPSPRVSEEKAHTNDPHRAVSVMEVTESTGIRSDDLLTSEVAGSWSIDTAPSVHGENDYPRSHDRDRAGNYADAADALMCLSEGQAAESQVAAVTTKVSQEHQALNAMIGAMAPHFKEHFGGDVSSRGRDEADASISDSDTQENSDNDDDVKETDAVVPHDYRYNPYVQAKNKINQLKRLGHNLDKHSTTLLSHKASPTTSFEEHRPSLRVHQFAIMPPKEQIRWTEEMECKLTEVLLAEIQARGTRANNGIKADTYKAIAEMVNPLCLQTVTPLSVKTHIKHQRKKYSLAREAIHASGFGIEWDAENKYLTADQEAWKGYCKGKDQMLKGMLRKAFKLYDTLYQVYGDDTASGNLGYADGDSVDTAPSVGETPNDLAEDEDVRASVDSQPTLSREGKRKRERGNSSHYSADTFDRMASAIEDLSSSFKERNRQAEAAAKKRAEFEVALVELTSLGLEQRYRHKVTTLLASNPGYERAFMFTPRESRVEYVMSLLEDQRLL